AWRRGSAHHEERRAYEPAAAGGLGRAPEKRDREVAEVEREEIRRDAEGAERRPGERVPDGRAQVRVGRVGREREEAERQDDGDRAGRDRLGLADEMGAGDRRLPAGRHPDRPPTTPTPTT